MIPRLKQVANGRLPLNIKRFVACRNGASPRSKVLEDAKGKQTLPSVSPSYNMARNNVQVLRIILYDNIMLVSC